MLRQQKIQLPKNCHHHWGTALMVAVQVLLLLLNSQEQQLPNLHRVHPTRQRRIDSCFSCLLLLLSSLPQALPFQAQSNTLVLGQVLDELSCFFFRQSNDRPWTSRTGGCRTFQSTCTKKLRIFHNRRYINVTAHDNLHWLGKKRKNEARHPLDCCMCCCFFFVFSLFVVCAVCCCLVSPRWLIVV